MAGYRAVIGVIRSRPRFFNFPVAAKRGRPKTEPDLDLIKQVEQVTILVLEGLAAICEDSEHRDHGGGSDPRISNLAIIGLADISLQRQRKQPEAAEGNLFAKGQSGN